MGLWRDILRVLGLTNDARVQISAPGIDVVITGDPEQVRQLLGVVKHELERSAARREVAEGRRKTVGTGQVVRPTELDEMDSPYVLPEAMVLPVEDTTGELVRTPVDEDTVDEPRHRSVRAASDEAKTREVRSHPLHQRPDTATLLPEGAAFHTDGGPTITPTDNNGDLVGTNPEVKDVESSNP